MNEPSPETPRPEDEELAPFGSWPKMYGLVLGVLVVEIVLLTLFTRAFS